MNLFQNEEINKVLWTVALDIGASILIVIVFSIVRSVGAKLIKKAFNLNIDKIQRVTGGTQRRKSTLEGLCLNTWKYALNIMILLAILAVFIDTKTIIASSAAIGVVVGFAAKSTLNDLMMGFFIVFEDLFSVGDFIELNGVSGTVLEVGLRVTKLRVLSGETVIIPNGSVGQLNNFAVSNGNVVLDVSVAYEADLEKAIKVLEDLASEAKDKYPQMVALPEVLGVQKLGSSDVVIRLVVEVEPLQQWHIKRELNKMIKLRFDEEGIEIPFPRMVVYQQN
ncbi:MAG: mechanosensitive ion channel family protein [Turicibacter sp.]